MNPFQIQAWRDFLAAIHALRETQVGICRDRDASHRLTEDYAIRLDRARTALQMLSLVEDDANFVRQAIEIYWWPQLVDVKKVRDEISHVHAKSKESVTDAINRKFRSEIFGPLDDIVTELTDKLRKRNGLSPLPVWPAQDTDRMDAIIKSIKGQIPK